MNRRFWLAGLICWTGWMLFSSGAEAVLVTFKHKDPDASRVTLAGGFNDWNMDAEAMSKNDDGDWETRVDLKPGKYEYKFVVDGDWDKANKDNRSITVKAEAGTEDAAAEAGPVDVTFRYKAPDAKDVAVGSEFNEWKWESSRMTKGEDGVWTLTVSLSPGEYAYKFVVDGDWREDPDNPLKKTVGDAENSMIRVGRAAKGPTSPESDKSNEVTFRYKTPDAKDVGVGAEFNEWKWESSRMTKGEDGVWTLTVNLVPGEYAYKFVVDGDWRVDPDNPLKKEVGGEQNSMIRVGRPAPSAPETGSKTGTTFSVKAEKAKRVTLAGDFNGWKPDDIVLESKGDGMWEATIDLKPGKYEYKFLADGDWDVLGKENRKIEVK